MAFPAAPINSLYHSSHRPDQVEAALDQTLSDLGLDYIDLYLMHWPVASTPHGNVINYLDVSPLLLLR